MELATACSNLADLEWSMGMPAAAESLYRRALSIDESVYGPDHTEVAADLANLGFLLKESGNPALASPLLRRALAIYEKELGQNSDPARKIRDSIIP